MKNGLLPLFRRGGRISRVSLLSVSIAILLANGLHAQTTPAFTTTSLAVTSGGNPVTTVASGTVITLTATVKTGTAALTLGQVNFCDASVTYCTDIHLLATAQLTSAGTATLKFRPGIGTHSYRAVFAGTKADAASKSATMPLSVTGPHLTATALAQSGSAGNYTLTATVSGNGPAVPTGTVSFIDSTDANSVLATTTLAAGAAGPIPLSTLFSEPPAYIGTGAAAFAVGDFNGDGILDFAVGNPSGSAGGSVTIYLGNGDGTFTPTAAIVQLAGYPSSMVAGDFNGDGILDLAVGQASSVEILLGKGDGTFTSAPASPQTGSSATVIAAADFNGDGNVDLVLIDGSGVTAFPGNGDGTFAPGSSLAAGADPIAITVADFNGDGIPDLAVLNQVPEEFLRGVYSDGVTVLLGNGDGTFTAAEAEFGLPGDKGYWGIAAADLRGNGVQDLLVENSENGSNLMVLLSNGDGTFTEKDNNAAGFAGPITVGDFNGDGIADVAADDGGNVTFYLGAGEGTFSAVSTQVAGCGLSYFDSPVSLTAADFNGDGIPDLAEMTYVCELTVNLTANQIATTAATSVAVGPAGSGMHQVVAKYPGDSNYAASTSTVSLQAATVTPSVSLTPSANPVNFGTLVTGTVTVTGSAGTPTGTVTVLDGTTTLNSSGVATFTSGAVILFAGTYSVVASYSGNASYSPANSAALSLEVNRTAPPIALTSSASTAAFGMPVTFTATLTGVSITPSGSVSVLGYPPTGTVTFFDGATQVGSATLKWTGVADGVATFTTSSLGIGSHSITASYSGDSNFTAVSSTSLGLSVSKGNPTVGLASSAEFIVRGTPVTFTSTVTGFNGVIPTGMVQFTCGATNLGTFPLSAGGVATVTFSRFGIGGHGIIATYEGDSNYNPAVSSVHDIRDDGALTPSVALTTTATQVAKNSAVFLTATVTGSGPQSTGEVYFYDSATPHDTISMVLNASGVASYTPDTGILGTHTITAVYSGDNNYRSETSSPLVVTVTTP